MDKQEQQRRAKIVVEEYNGILPYFEAFYIHSIIYAAAQAEVAFAFDKPLNVHLL